MKELTRERIFEIVKKIAPDVANAQTPDTLLEKSVLVVQEAYRLGQQEAWMNEQRFQAACAAMQGMLSSGNGFDANDSCVAHIAKSAAKQADALLAELNRTAEKGGEGCE